MFITVFSPIVFVSLINFIDFFLLPTEYSSDVIVNFYVSKSKSGTIRAFHYETEKGYKFSLSNIRIYESKINLVHTRLFESITYVESEGKDYSHTLTSDLHGFMKYFHLLFLFSMIIGIVTFARGKPLSDNVLLNIIGFNSLMLLVLIYMLYLY
jgi:hypothetical protein